MGWSAARTAAGAVHGFPAALTSFVGRRVATWACLIAGEVHAQSRPAHRPGRRDPAGAAAFEEGALLTTLGDRYRRYASQHKRLVPLVW